MTHNLCVNFLVRSEESMVKLGYLTILLGLFSNFVAFSEYPNFIFNFVPSSKSLSLNFSTKDQIEKTFQHQEATLLFTYVLDAVKICWSSGFLRMAQKFYETFHFTFKKIKTKRVKKEFKSIIQSNYAMSNQTEDFFKFLWPSYKTCTLDGYPAADHFVSFLTRSVTDKFHLSIHIVFWQKILINLTFI